MVVWFSGLVCLTLGVAGCGPEPTAFESEPPSNSTTCKLGCIETDPNPASPGVWLTSAVTPDQCIDSGSTDTDQDDLADRCEFDIAAAFAPELYYGNTNRMDREPHWVARPLGPSRVRVGHLLSYRVDGGTQDPLCDNALADGPCAGHYGDSEAIWLDVYYNGVHWVLDTARYSAHGDLNVYGRGTQAYPTILTHPSHPGAYPRTWVSYGKHANYATDALCDAGGFLGYDTCISDTSVRLSAGGNLNVGSRLHHTSSQDCMPSSDPIYSGNGVTECYWTERPFSGWTGLIPTAAAYSDPTKKQLQYMGF